MKLTCAAALLAFVPGAAQAAALPPFPHFPASCRRGDFRALGSAVRAELCTPAGPSDRRHPAVIVLHGCGGFSTFDHRLATELPAGGVSTLYVDFFGLTPPPGRRGFCGGRGRGLDPFPTWQQIVVAGAASLERTTSVEPRRIGIVGWSLGGALAVATAELPRSPFRALVGFSVGAFGPILDHAGALPPSLLLSGGRHDAIPLSDTRLLYERIRRAGVPAALFVYPGGTHQWPGKQGTAGIRRAIPFLRHYLGG